MKATDYFAARKKAKQDKREARIEALAQRPNVDPKYTHRQVSRASQAHSRAKDLHEVARRREEEKLP